MTRLPTISGKSLLDRWPRIDQPALAATIMLHVVAALIALHVSTTTDTLSRPAASATMTLIDIAPDSGAALDVSTRAPSTALAATPSALETAHAPPLPVAIALTPVPGSPAGAPGAGGFDPYAGAAPLNAAGDAVAGTKLLPLAQAQQSAMPLEAGLSELRSRIAHDTPDARGYLMLTALIDSAGTVRDVRVVRSSLNPRVPEALLRDEARDLQLFATGGAGAAAWRNLPMIRL